MDGKKDQNEEPEKELALAFLCDWENKRLAGGVLKVLKGFQDAPIYRVPLEDIEAWIENLKSIKKASWSSFSKREEFLEGIIDGFLKYAESRGEVTRWERLVSFYTLDAVTRKLGGISREKDFMSTYKDSGVEYDEGRLNYEQYIWGILIELYGKEANEDPAGPLAFLCLSDKSLYREGKSSKDLALKKYLELKDLYEGDGDLGPFLERHPVLRDDRCACLILNQHMGSGGADLYPRPKLSFSESIKYFFGGDKRIFTKAAVFRLVLLFACLGLGIGIIIK